MVDYILGDKVSNWKTADRPTGQHISGKQVTLQRLVPGDAEGLFGELDKAEGEHDWNYMPFGPFETAATLRDWITSVVDSSDVVFYSMRRRADDLPFGLCSFLNIKPEVRALAEVQKTIIVKKEFSNSYLRTLTRKT